MNFIYQQRCRVGAQLGWGIRLRPPFFTAISTFDAHLAWSYLVVNGPAWQIEPHLTQVGTSVAILAMTFRVSPLRNFSNMPAAICAANLSWFSSTHC